MKKKFSKILGVGLAFVLVVSLMAFALPVLADPVEEFEPSANEWTDYVRTAGSAGDWFIQGAAVDDELIGNIGPIAQAIDGDLYAYVGDDADTPRDLLKSEDGGRTWAASTSTTKSYNLASGGAPIVDMVCSSMDEDILYVTDGNYVYKSVDGGDTFAKLAAASLETLLAGLCGCPIYNEPITCIDVGYDANDNPLVFIGTKVEVLDWPDPDPLDCESLAWTTPASVFFIAEAVYPVEWLDLGLHCYSCGGFTPWAIGATPEFADTGEVMVVVTRPLTIDFYAGVAGTITMTAGPEGATLWYSGYPTGITGPAGAGPKGAGTVGIGPDASFPLFSGTSSSDHTITIEPRCGADGGGAWTLEVTTDPGTVAICGGTHVVSTIGTYCHWTEEAELLKDCLGPFEIQLASRIGYPDDWADSETLFVGVVGVYYDTDTSYGGDVYSVTSPSALDLNVAGYSSGCIGLVCSTDIISLDIFGAADEASLIAGVYDPGELSYLYYSTDGGWEWDHCDKAPSGMGPTYVLWVGDSAIAATAGCECAVSLSCGEEVGEYFNQISLIATDEDWVGDISHAPGYLTGTSPIFIVTRCDDCCGRENTWSVFRYDQTYWERVYVSTLLGFKPIAWVEVSPDFDTTEAVFVANSGFDIFWSVDAGCSWKEMRYPCEPKPAISAWVVIDEDTVLCGGAGGDAGTIFKTTNHGAGPWDEYEAKNAGDGVDFDLSPNIADDGSILYGDDLSNAYISEDLGETWDMIGAASTAHYPTYVIFDPGYGTSGDEGEFVVYAATYTVIDRCTIDPDKKWSKQKWVEIYDELAMATGIDAAGDTALYVSDMGEAGTEFVAGAYVYAYGTVAVRCPETGDTADLEFDLLDLLEVTEISGDFILGELVEIIEYNMYYTDGCCYEISGWIELKGDESLEFNILDVDGCLYDVVDGPFIDGESLSIEGYALDFNDRWGWWWFSWVDGAETDRVEGTIQVEGALSEATGYLDIYYYEENFMPDDGYEWDEALTVEDAALDVAVSGLEGMLGIKGHDSEATGTIHFYACVDLGAEDQAVALISSHLRIDFSGDLEPTARDSGVVRSLNPMADAADVVFEWLREELDADSMLAHPSNSDDLWLTTRSNVLWALDQNNLPYIWVWEDPLATPVIQESPADGTQLTSTSKVTLEWEALDDADEYEISLYRYCPQCPDEKDPVTVPDSEDTCAIIGGLEAGSTYYWKVRVAEGKPFLSKWSELWEFNTALDEVPDLCSPVCGGQDIILTTNFSWDAVSGASGYELQIVAASADGTSDFTGAETLTTDVNALASFPGLDYSTTYYWRVRAVKDGVPGAWSVCIFTTEAPPVVPPEPVPPVEIPPLPAPITPMWIWVIIGIGAALTIAVIVLIVTTRRVP